MHKYKFVLFILIFAVVPSKSLSQINDTKKYNLITKASTLGIGFTNILDPYLSPFEYSGNNLEYVNDSRKYKSPTDTTFSLNNRYSILIGEAKHPAKLNSMMFFNGNYEIGYYYHFRPIKNLTCLTGGSWDLDFGGKYIARNVNNPFSVDLFTDLNISLSANYKFSLNVFNWINPTFRAEYGMKTPILGYMFVPPQGASYYEIFSLGNYSDSFHLTSLHNKRAFSHYFNLDIPSKYTTFRIGVKSDFLQYKTDDLVYHNYNYSVYAGCIIDLYVFNGTKNKPPTNFNRAY